MIAYHIHASCHECPRATTDSCGRPNLDGRDSLQSIPVVAEQKILSFCDISSFALFAATSTSYQRFVFQECPFLWTAIDFGKVKKRQSARPTDECLNSLLSYVNARRDTTFLSLI
jgi:hypothetical protein